MICSSVAEVNLRCNAAGSSDRRDSLRTSSPVELRSQRPDRGYGSVRPIAVVWCVVRLAETTFNTLVVSLNAGEGL